MDEFTTVFLFTDKVPLYEKVTSSAIIFQFAFFLALFVFLLILIGDAIKKSSFLKARVIIGGRIISLLNFVLLSPIILVCFYISLLLFLEFFGTMDYIIYKDEFKHLESIYQSQDYQVTEGYVNVKHVQPYNGHDIGDIIEIGNTELEVDLYSRTFGYKITIAHNGVLTEGTYARVYFTEDPSRISKYTILRIDIKR